MTFLRFFRAKPSTSAADEALFRIALERFPEAMIFRDREQRILFVNRKAEELFHIRAADVVGRSIPILTDPGVSRLRFAFSLDVASGKETRFTLPEGERSRAFMVADIPVLEDGTVYAILRLFRETTREEEISRLKTQAMSIAAHQLRTPASTLQWVVQMFLAGEVGPITDGQRELLQRSSQTINRMTKLISDLLDVTRIEEGRFGYTFRSEPAFSVFIERIVESLRDRADAKGIALTFHGPAKPLPPLLLDESRLTLAIENLVANAITYTVHGSVDVAVERRNADVAVLIRDTGIGIPEKEQAKVFTKFFRAQNAVQMGIEGTGLGLFIVRSVIRRHGGDVAIASREGAGTTVTVLLPVDPKRVPSGEVPAEEAIM